ncbi:YfiT family bacillithiol transferase [Paenibacillus roseipurpureus]|uniref:Metal-dependent hydrolase n=1 Tax=Paenibacillus roseopurpureus TaxID=2918901 RepID=A0AA96LLQ5_9BACL|nr:putative metal-dependent hydrolase [Paenibacillus sp. MBLB1832]WNR44070.1 putative metal-dependent hydrolase [Paenibacillus sp. MBLB1832]
MDLSIYLQDFKEQQNPSFEEIQLWIQEIEKAPRLIKSSVVDLQDEQLDKSYREGGWTIRQIVHHMADSNLNAYWRFKRTLTEESPLIPSYNQNKLAELVDYKEPIDESVQLIEIIYARFLILLRKMEPSDYKRTMNSEYFGVMSLEKALQRYVWHDRHHLAQIELAKVNGC